MLRTDMDSEESTSKDKLFHKAEWEKVMKMANAKRMEKGRDRQGKDGTEILLLFLSVTVTGYKW